MFEKNLNCLHLLANTYVWAYILKSNTKPIYFMVYCRRSKIADSKALIASNRKINNEASGYLNLRK